MFATKALAENFKKEENRYADKHRSKNKRKSTAVMLDPNRIHDYSLYYYSFKNLISGFVTSTMIEDILFKCQT
jgi:hypothetical protein